MKISVEKKDLISVLSKTQNIVEKRNTMPVLINILLVVEESHLQVFATDLEVSLTDRIDVKVSQPGKLAVNAKNLFDIVRELDEDLIHLEAKSNHRLQITQRKSVFNIVGLGAEEYPVFPTFQSKDFMTIESSVFSDMIDRTIYSVSNDETRYHLNGVYFEQNEEAGKTKLRMVATDGHRLSVVDRFSTEKSTDIIKNGVIIPRKGLVEIKKLIDFSQEKIEMAIEGSQLIVKTNSTVLMVRLIEGKYPNYQQLIPNDMKKKASIDRELLLSSIRRVSLLSNQKSKGVTISLSGSKMEISSNNPDLGDAKEEIDVNYDGDDMKIGFNAKYILDILNSFNEEKLNLELDGQLSPGLIRPNQDENYTCIVMPMRI